MTDIQIVILDTIKELAIENNVNEDEIKYFQIAYSLASKLCKAKNNEVLDLVSKSFIIEWDDEYVNRSGTTEYLKCDDIPKAINDFIKENPDNIITGAK
mgnify:CR=1 FL=1|tara:strand:- start:606 stop:902 length:297 start_codon:yes stop_codon:yes gene_type:complete